MYAVAVVIMVAMARTCTCNSCQLRCGSAFLDVRKMLRFVLNVCKVVTFVLINVFPRGKKYVVGIGE